MKIQSLSIYLSISLKRTTPANMKKNRLSNICMLYLSFICERSSNVNVLESGVLEDDLHGARFLEKSESTFMFQNIHTQTPRCR